MTPPALPKPTILVVDDTVENLRVLSIALTKQGYDVRGVVNGAMALRAAQADPPDLILLDIRMPGMDGYEVCRCLKEANQTREIPIIFLSALGDSLDKVQAFAVGGADYVTKPFQLDEVLVRVKNQLDVRVAHNMVQEINHILEQQVQARTAELAIANQTLRQEIEDRKRIEADLRESEARYRLVADNITDLVGLHDLQGRFIYVSPSCDRLLGYAAPDLMEKPLYDLIHGEDRERVHLQIQAGLNHREILQLVYRVQNKAEHELWLETSVRPIINAQGQVEQFQTASRDVTKRMAIAEQLRRQALYDDLTQLPNRTLFMDRVSYALHHWSLD